MNFTSNQVFKQLVVLAFSFLGMIAGLMLPSLSKALNSSVLNELVSNPSAAIENLPLAFERYAGQGTSKVQFVSRALGYTVFLEPRQATIAFGSAARSQV